MPAGTINWYRLLGHLRFCKLRKSPLSLKASLLTLLYLLLPSDTELASAPVSIAESFNEGDLVHATASESSGPTLSKAETLELFSHCRF